MSGQQKGADEKSSEQTEQPEGAPVPVISMQGRKKRIPCSQMDLPQRLDYACDCMGYTKQSIHTYTSIDFCLDEIGKIDWVCHFTGLKELTIVNNSVTEIEGIDKCRFLEKIWLSENSIEVMRNFDKLTNLRHLYLSSNKIKRIRGLDTLIGLQKLWLDGNLIEHLDGLNHLSNIVELNLASNLIETIGVSLDALQNLKELNLAGNHIGSFKEVLNLNRLPQLDSCNFQDPNYGDNPICSLCNYSTYVLFHLPNLQRMDMKHITDDEKAFSESTFMKKRMYYNMRIKTIQRNTTNVIRILKICKNLRRKKLEIQADKLTRKLGEVEREIEERQYITEAKGTFEAMCTYGPDNRTENPLDQIDTETLLSDINQKKSFIISRVKQREEDLKVLEQLFESTKKKIYDISEQNINRLITELDTGGNIRFEEGRPQDKWYTSCVDLVRSRFNPEQMGHLGICGISVTRVTRIHNRFLRNRFEDKLEQLVDLTDSSYKRNLEYLFYGTNPQAPKEMHKAMEEGFRSNQEYEDAGLPACVSLVNSVASAEIPRLNNFYRVDQNGKSPSKKEKPRLLPQEDQMPIPSGQILVCKIFLQKCVHDTKTPFFNNAQSPSEIWRQSPLDPKSFQGIQSVYRVKEHDQKQRMWIVMDHGLSLPEYLVDFDFCTTQQATSESKRLSEITVLNDECNQLFQGVVQAQRLLESKIGVVAQNAQTAVETQSRQVVVPLTAQDLDRSDMSCLKKLLHSFMTTCHVKELMENNYEFVQDEKTGTDALENVMPPEIPLRSQFNLISEHLISNISRQPDFTCITYLNLFNNCIRRIEALDELINLQTLILSFNQIESIQGLTTQKFLVRLDLNHNFIRVVENLESQESLEFLDLRHNWIQDHTEIEKLQKFCPQLKKLSLKSNPVSNSRSYRASVFQIWAKTQPGLAKLDNISMKDRDRSVNQEQKELSQEMLVTAVKQLKKAHLFSGSEQNELVQEWERQIEMLDLSHLKISGISRLQNFGCLRKLLLLDNKIGQISGLENLKSLEELNLEKNKIQVIQNLEGLKSLKKLDLGSNQIKRIQNLSALQSLTQLSLENNKITRLDGLEDLTSLMELYIDNNLIADVQEILKLKDLPRLIILDCSCNPIASTQQNQNQNYRIFCIFSLRKLRVLDGISIDPQEHLEAKETFSGRLTDEMLQIRLQGRTLKDVRDLDLSNCKLRDFEDMFDYHKLPSIRELNLNGNMMVSLKAIGYMPSLKILRFRNNRLETLFCKPPVTDDKNFKRGLFGVLSLELLDVCGNQLQYLYGLQCQNLKDLKVLLASDNSITKIEHLEKLKQLRELDLSKNKIRQTEPRAFYFPSLLMSLRLDDNTIKQVQHIEQLDKLQVLSLQGTRISEFMELERIAELPHLTELSLLSTPLSRKPQYRLAVLKRLPQLEVLDGKEIPQEEKRRIELAAGGVIINPIQQQAPNIHFAQYPQQAVTSTNPGVVGKPTVKVSNMQFDGGQQQQLTPHNQQQLKNLAEYSQHNNDNNPSSGLDQNSGNVRASGKRPSTKAQVGTSQDQHSMLRSQLQQQAAPRQYLGQQEKPESLYMPSQFSQQYQQQMPQAGNYLQGLQLQQQQIAMHQQQNNTASKAQQRTRQAASQPQGQQLQPPLLQMQIQSLQSQQQMNRPPLPGNQQLNVNKRQ